MCDDWGYDVRWGNGFIGCYDQELQYQFKYLQMSQTQKYQQSLQFIAQPSEDSLIQSPQLPQGQIFAKNDGLWSEEEVFKFISYLIFNKQPLRLKLQRRTSKVFKQMSQFIKSRTSVQCRSQNQRMFRKYKNMKNILSAFKEEYGSKRFEEEYNCVKNDPFIRFKTEYQDYIQQHVKKGRDVGTQTDQPSLFSPQTTFAHPFLSFNYDQMLPVGGSYSNWVVIPYYS